MINSAIWHLHNFVLLEEVVQVLARCCAHIDRFIRVELVVFVDPESDDGFHVIARDWIEVIEPILDVSLELVGFGGIHLITFMIGLPSLGKSFFSSSGYFQLTTYALVAIPSILRT